jgi:hypothetical protein
VTVQELISALSHYPADTRVLVDGYEEGLAEPRIRTSDAAYLPGPSWRGDWSEPEAYEQPTGREEPVVVVGRYSMMVKEVPHG